MSIAMWRPAYAGSRVSTLALSLALGLLGAQAARSEEVTLTVALAANPQMETAAKLIGAFYEKYPDIKVSFSLCLKISFAPLCSRM